MTFGFQAQRMDANERERTYGSLATFGFSNVADRRLRPAPARCNAATGNAYASFLLGELNATTVIEDSEVATSGRFRTYAFWVQDDFKVTPKLALNLGLRYDIMKPYTEVYDRWSFMNPDLPNPAVGGYPGALQFAGFGDNSCQCRTPIETYYGNIGPRARRRLQPERPHGAARRLRDHVLAARRRRRPRRRAQRHRHARLLGQRVVPEHERVRAGLQLEQRRARRIPTPPFFDPDAQHRLRHRARQRRRRHLRRSGDRRPSAALPELERRACSTR